MSCKQKLIMFAIVWGTALLLALTMHFIGGVNIWFALGIVVIAWVANGLLAEREDRQPGGFLNPKRPPK